MLEEGRSIKPLPSAGQGSEQAAVIELLQRIGYAGSGQAALRIAGNDVKTAIGLAIGQGGRLMPAIMSAMLSMS